jgi:hypothetical protein
MPAATVVTRLLDQLEALHVTMRAAGRMLERREGIEPFVIGLEDRSSAIELTPRASGTRQGLQGSVLLDGFPDFEVVAQTSTRPRHSMQPELRPRVYSWLRSWNLAQNDRDVNPKLKLCYPKKPRRIPKDTTRQVGRRQQRWTGVHSVTISRWFRTALGRI